MRTFIAGSIFMIGSAFAFCASASTLLVPSQYATISAAVASSTDGDVIQIASGTYAEQVIVTKNITLQGAGQGLTILSLQGSLPTGYKSGSIWKPVLGISTTTAVIQDMTIDGHLGIGGTIITGIFVSNSSATINRVTVQQFRSLSNGGALIGNAVMANNADGVTRTVTLASSTLTDAQRTYVSATGAGLTFIADGNTLVNSSSSDQSPSVGISISAPAVAIVRNNSFRDFICKQDGTCATGFLDVSLSAGADSNSSYTNNSFNNVDYAINLAANPPVMVSNNFINHAGVGIGMDSDNYTVNNNVISNSSLGIGVVAVDGDDPSHGVSASGNVISNSSTSIKIYNTSTGGAIPPNFTAHQNDFSFVTLVLASTTNGTIDLASNWWGTASSATIKNLFQGVGAGLIQYDPYYLNPSRSILSNSFSGTTVQATSTNFDLATSSNGQAALPSGISTITLSNSTALNVASTTNQVVSGQVILRGATTTLSNFTSGSLTNQDISQPQNIGGVSVTVGQAVALSSGVSSTPILIQNSSLPSTTLSIPDNTAVLAPSGWNGTIAPPTTGSTAGTMPSGYSSVSNVVDAGSSLSELLFDTPTTITLSGVTGTLGYKAAGGSSWTAISTCAGSYASPTNPVFPGECSVSDGVNTKVLTFHL